MNRFEKTIGVFLLSTLSGACASVPADLDTSLERPSRDRVYIVALEPPTTEPAINQIHSWRVRLATPDGKPVRAARFAVDGGMPEHGHGLPTQPRVTREIVDGTYLLEGMKFSMTGWWEIKLAIQAEQGSDTVTFNRVVARPAASR